MTQQSDQDGDALASKKGADPVAARSEDLTHAGGPLAGEPGAGGAGFGSGVPRKGGARPSGERAESDAPIASDVAPIVHTAMDGDLRAVEERAHRTTRPGAEG
jgi:hypothetical protein